LRTGEELRRFVLEKEPANQFAAIESMFIQTFALAQDGRTVALQGQRPGLPNKFFISLWDLAADVERVRRWDPLLLSCVFAPDVKSLGGAARFVGLGQPEAPVRLGLPAPPAPAQRQQPVLQEVTTGRHLLAVPQPDQGGDQIWAFAPDGQTFVTVTHQMTQEG